MPLFPGAAEVLAVAARSPSPTLVQPLHSPSPADILIVRFSLLRRLPIELVDLILHAAEYYSRCTDPFVALPPDRDIMTVRGGARLAALTPPIPHPERVMKVVIRTESHDQGWSSYPEDHGTYNNSWTWFELQISRDESVTGREGVVPDVPGWRICTNRHARVDWQVVEVVLDRTNEVVSGLRPGDRLGVVAKARYPGWVNDVRRAEIDVFSWI
ncbi:hypothetical protein BC834DRAFT_885160 [Gloeopeniophorella convolvens]|nr:hypothetical protein BC834DRAFT_885160 [Gloeopeniophorella convolvens]